MNIIIVGDGKVGYALAEQLANEQHDIVIIDHNPKALLKARDNLDVMTIRGDGASFAALSEAGVDTADMLIAATSSDEKNMVCCLLAKKLGVQYTAARIRDPEYAKELTILRDKLGLDLVINPEMAAAVDISRILRFPSAMNIEPFARGAVEIVEYRAHQSDPDLGVPIAKVRLPEGVMFGGIIRDDIARIPHGDSTIEDNDRVLVVGTLPGITKYFKHLGRFNPRSKSVLILGGGRIGYYLAEIITRLSMKVRIIEIDKDKCAELDELLPEAIIIQGDGTDQELLESEGIREVDAFIALTDRDEENLITSLFAMQAGVPKVIAKINRLGYSGVIQSLGIDSIISPKVITANNIVRYVRGLQASHGEEMKTLHPIADSQLEVMEFMVEEGQACTRMELRKMPLKRGVLIAVIVRNRKVIIPSGKDMLLPGDSVILVTRLGIKALEQICD